MIPGDQARASVSVALPPDETFRVFTQEIDRWWRRGPRFRQLRGDAGLICIEPAVGGRVFESIGDHVAEIGRVLAWEPGRRLVFSWRASNFTGDESTEVEVAFQPTASGGTLLTVTHRGWASLRPDHPVRHGAPAPEFIARMGLWWGALLTALREHSPG